MSSLSRELVFLILQFLDEEKFKESVHRLEKESGFFFNTKYFDEKVLAGEWDEVEKYLSGFTKLDDNRYSMKIFFEIRKQKYLEALDKQDKAKAVEILVQDLRVFSTFNEELYKEITQLLTLHNFRENEQLSKYGDTKTARTIMLGELKKLIEANPLFRDKLTFPTLRSSRLRTLINQSLNWQHQLCKNPRPNPDIKTLFTDHTCAVPNGPLAPSQLNQPITTLTKPTAFPSLGAHAPFPPGAAVAAAANAGALASWMAAAASGASTVQAAAVTPASIPMPQNQVSILKRPPATPGVVDYQNPEHELMKRLRPAPSVEEVTYPAPRQHAPPVSLEDLPLKAALALHQGSTVTSMEFHPMQNTLLLVGSATGEIALWELAAREKLVSRPFKIWDMANCSPPLQALIAKETPMSVIRVAWSPDGNFIGVAYAKHLIHLYAFSGPNELRQHAEVDAHVGAVNDLAFANPNRQLCVVTCGDDQLIKVWDVSGRKHFTFEGHEAPVYSICPHHKENIQFIFSTAIDGKIKAWLYDNMGSRVDYDAPGKWCTTMLYSADGTRLFSCGTSKDGDVFLVEWNESEETTQNPFKLGRLSSLAAMGVSLRHFSPSSFWVSRRPRASSSVLSLLVPRHRILTRKVVITNGNARYCTASASGGSHGFQHSGRQGSSSTVEFSGEWKLSVGSKTAIMVPPTVKLTGAVSAWRKEEVNQDDASGNGSNYFRSFVPKIDYGNYQTLDNQLESRGDVVTTVDRELNGFAQQKSQRGPLVALPMEKIDDKNTVSISKVGKRTDLSKVHANLTKIYNKVRVVDNVSTAKEIVTKLVNQYRDLVHACDTEVSRIDVKSETPVDHGELICFSICCGSEVDFGDGKSCIWVDVLGENGKDVLAEFKPFFEDSSIKKVWHNYSFDNHIIRNYGINLSGFHGDTMHMARLWDSSRQTSGGYSLEALTSDPRVLGGTDTKEEAELFGKVSMKTIFGKGKLKKDGTEGKVVVIPPVEELQKDDREAWISYSALDSISTLKLYESMKKQLQAKKWFLDGKLVSGKNMFDFYQEFWQPFGELLAKMEAEGMLVDREYLAQIEVVAKAEQEVAVSRFRSWASKHCPDAKHMNVGSDTQLRQLFFGGITNSCSGEDLPYEKLFKVPNVDNVIEEGKKRATKFRNIKLHRISDNPLPTEKFTASGWPSVSGATLKALAGKVSAAYDFTEVAADDNSLEENMGGDEEFMSLPDEILETENSDTSAFGTAFDAFGGGESGKEACHAIASLCEVCSIDSLISNFILPLQGSNVSGKDGRVHCSLNINTETGRLSARRPNLQNQPALEKDRYKIRQAFIASPGNSLIVADYGQLELRILAHLARCKSMMEAFVAGGDFHSRTAMNMYPHIREAVENGQVLLEWHPQPGQEKPPVPLLKDAFASERRKAKMLNFSIAYGKTAIGLSRDWKVSVEEAQETVNLWYNDRQEVRKWQELRKKEAIQNGYVLTLLGRARKFPAYRSRAQKNHIERAAINTPVQGSAADVAMCAMLEITTNERLNELGWKLLLQVHDEVILEGPSESAELAKSIVVDCMCKPFNGKNILSVDLSVDAKCAQNWYAAK